MQVNIIQYPNNNLVFESGGKLLAVLSGELIDFNGGAYAGHAQGFTYRVVGHIVGGKTFVRTESKSIPNVATAKALLDLTLRLGVNYIKQHLRKGALKSNEQDLLHVQFKRQARRGHFGKHAQPKKRFCVGC